MTKTWWLSGSQCHVMPNICYLVTLLVSEIGNLHVGTQQTGIFLHAKLGFAQGTPAKILRDSSDSSSKFPLGNCPTPVTQQIPTQPCEVLIPIIQKKKISMRYTIIIEETSFSQRLTLSKKNVFPINSKFRVDFL